MSQQEKETVSPAKRLGAAQQIMWWVFALAFAGGAAALIETGRLELFLRIFAVVLVVAGVATLIYGLRAMRMARQSEDWFPVDAFVLSARVETEGAPPNARGRGTTYYTPRIEYEYHFQDGTYRSDRLLFANVNYPREEAEKLVAEHPAGSRLRIFVDPDHPEKSVVEKGWAGHGLKYYIPFIAAALFLIFGLAAWFLAPRAAP